jgi:protein-S-isoprenylcysteine O-methyltransferase Ste14
MGSSPQPVARGAGAGRRRRSGVVPGLGGVWVPWWILTRHGHTATPAAWEGVPIIAAGTALDVWCVWNSWVSNPIYLAALLIVLEEAWLFMSQALLAYAAAMAVLFHLFITGYEQPTLRSRFGSTYLEYQRPVISYGVERANESPRWRRSPQTIPYPRSGGAR